MKFKMYALIAVISALLVSQNLVAQEIHERERDRDKLQIHQKLNLSDEQIKNMESLRLNHQKEMIDLRADVERKELKMIELKSKGNYTREEYLNTVNGIISAKNKIELFRANHQMDAYQLLDDNQKQEWNKMTRRFEEERKHKIMRKMRDFDVD